MLDWLYSSVSNGVSSIATTVNEIFHPQNAKDGLQKDTLGLQQAASKLVEEFKMPEDPKKEVRIPAAPVSINKPAKEPTKVVRTEEFEKRFQDKIEKSPALDDVELAFPKPIIPIPGERTKPFTMDTPASLIIAEMMTRAQMSAASVEEPATLKLDAVEKRLQREKKALRAAERQAFDTKKAANEWDQKSRITNYLLSGATFITGAGLMASGIPSGAILMTSSGGSIAAQLMEDYGVNENIVSATSIGSGLLALAGGIHSWYYAPQRMAEGMSAIITNGASVFTTLAGAFQTYTGYKRNENLSEVMKLEALHTITETKVKVLLDKLPSTTAMFQNSTKSLSGMIKGLARCHKRSTDAFRMAMAAFPA
ncbi:MAG: hypothetical protein S4CHLAM37_14390 [Chlamydiia bacterium]|nr:hypothetical protein [Chlamydiia bacterium]